LDLRLVDRYHKFGTLVNTAPVITGDGLMSPCGITSDLLSVSHETYLKLSERSSVSRELELLVG